jgi:hypothetical protein
MLMGLEHTFPWGGSLLYIPIKMKMSALTLSNLSLETPKEKD